MPKKSFIESFASGLKVGAVIGDALRKKEEKKKAEDIWSEVSKNPDLANNPAELWNTYAQRLVAEGVLTPEKAQEIAVRGYQMQASKLELDRVRAFDEARKRVEGIVSRANKLWEQGKKDEYYKAIRPLIDSYNAIPDGIAYKEVKTPGGDVRLVPVNEVTGKPMGEGFLATPGMLQRAAPALMYNLASLRDPSMLQNAVSLLSQGGQNLSKNATTLQAAREAAAGTVAAARLKAAGNLQKEFVKGRFGVTKEVLGNATAAGVKPEEFINLYQMLASTGLVPGTNPAAGMEAAKKLAEQLLQQRQKQGSGVLGGVIDSIGQLFSAHPSSDRVAPNAPPDDPNGPFGYLFPMFGNSSFVPDQPQTPPPAGIPQVPDTTPAPDDPNGVFGRLFRRFGTQ